MVSLLRSVLQGPLDRMVPAIVAERSRVRRETLRTGPPVDDFRFIDLVPRAGDGSQARRLATGAVHVDQSPASATDKMVVVVPDPILVEGRRPCGLDPPDKALPGQDAKGVVYRLSRDGADLSANGLGEVVRRGVGPSRHCPQHRQALGRDLDTMFA